jgi:regulator of RNase E activity RraA
VIVADGDGVIVIPPHRVQEALDGVEAIVAREAELDAEVAVLRNRVA